MAYDPNDPKDKEIVDGLIAEATAALTAKRDELLEEVRTLKKNRGNTGDERLKADLEAAEAKLAKAQSDLEAANNKTKRLERDLGSANEKVTGLTETNQKLVSSNALEKALASVKVVDKLRGGVEAMMAGKIKVVEVDADGGKTLQAQIDGKPVADYLKDWAASDEGKPYIAAPVNGGGGAPGSGDGGGNPSQPTKTRTEFDAMPHDERHKFLMEDKGKVVDAAPG